MVGVPALILWPWGPSSRITWPSLSRCSRGTPQAVTPPLTRAASSSGAESWRERLCQSLNRQARSRMPPSSKAMG